MKNGDFLILRKEFEREAHAGYEHALVIADISFGVRESKVNVFKVLYANSKIRDEYKSFLELYYAVA